MLSRKNRMLAISALILTVVFIMIVTTTNSIGGEDDDIITMNVEGATKEELKQKQEVAQKLKDTDNLNDVVRNPKNGEIDESKVKQAEEIISAKAANNNNNASPKKQLLTEDNLKSPVDVSDSKSTEKTGETFDAAKEFKQIMSVSPVVMFSKTYCPYSKALKALLKTQYNITPEPAIVELDKHENGAALQQYVGEKSGRRTVPNLFINGISRGGSDDMHALHEKNDLLASLQEWGGKSISVDKVNAPSNS